MDGSPFTGTVTAMNVTSFLNEAATTAIPELVERLGGWDAVLNTWRSCGDHDAQFADVWEVSQFLFANNEVFADRMGVDPSVVVQFASMVQIHATTGSLEQAQDLLGSFCSDTADTYEEFARKDPRDIDAAELGRFWRSWANGFSARAPRVSISPFA